MQFKQWLLTEEIWQNKTATVYHRTSPENIPRILSTTFKSAKGCAYGCGLYTTIAIESQFSSYMSRYGQALIKFKISNLDEYVICHKSVAKKILGANYKISDQLKRLGLSDLYTDEHIKLFHDLMESDAYRSSKVAEEMYSKNNQLEHRAKGIIFYGESDGYVLVKYNPVEDSTIKILAYNTNAPVDDNKVMENLSQNIGWTKTFGKASVKSAFDVPEKDRAELYNQAESKLKQEYYRLQSDEARRRFLNLVSKRLSTLTDYEKRLFFDEAISEKVLNVVQKFYEAEPHLYQGLTFLETAVKANDLKIAKYLLSKKMPIRGALAVDAIKNKNPEMLKLLVDNGAHIDKYTLQAAVEANEESMIIYLMKKGLKPDQGALQMAIQKKNYAMFQYFVDRMEQDEIPEYAVMDFAHKGNKPAVEYLIEKGAKTQNAAAQAFHAGNEQMVWAILGKRKQNAEEVVQNACINHDVEFLQYLLKFGIKPTARCGILAFSYGSKTTDEYIEFLTQNNVSDMILNDPKFQNKPDSSSIYAAIQLSNNKFDTVKKILDLKDLPDGAFQSIYNAVKNQPDEIKKPILNYANSIAEKYATKTKVG